MFKVTKEVTKGTVPFSLVSVLQGTCIGNGGEDEQGEDHFSLQNVSDLTSNPHSLQTSNSMSVATYRIW